MQGSFREENEHNFLCFCSLICILHGKKMNLPNIFLSVLRHDAYKRLLKKILTIDNDYDLFKVFIEYDPSISKSKYISKYLNNEQAIKARKNVNTNRKKDIQPIHNKLTESKKPTVSSKEKLRKDDGDGGIVCKKNS